MNLADEIDEKEFQDYDFLKEGMEGQASASSSASGNSRTARMHLALQQYFGYTTFRPLQEKIINDVLDGKDVFVLMPTGGGKSLCYQLPALLLEGVTVVVSPLISLMKDQVDGLEANGVAAACMNSTMSARDIRDVKDAFLENRIKVLYVAPERLMMPSTISLLKRGKVSLFAIDEAHCISEWGHDFRPEYRKLKLLRQGKRGFTEVPVIALTATATERVKKDIISQLKLSIDPEKGPYVASFSRENLYYEIRPKKETFSEITDYLRRHRGDAGIIYCQSRSNVESLAAKLSRAGFRALPYHAGLTDAERARNQDRFLRDDVDIVVATVAFGMGIDKSNVRFVIHYDLPRNLESYYQETGRGGRDGGPCECILFFSRGDRFKIEYFIQQKTKEKEKEVALVQLRQMVAYCESRQCRRQVLLEYFGEQSSDSCGNCDACLQPKETFDGTGAAKKLIACVQELNQRFGTNYVIDVLVGSRNKKIKANRHDRSKCHGSGKEFTKEQWKGLASEMTSNGVLDVRGAQYPLLKLNARSRNILAGKERVELACPPGYEPGEPGAENFRSDSPEVPELLVSDSSVPDFPEYSDVFPKAEIPCPVSRAAPLSLKPESRAAKKRAKSEEGSASILFERLRGLRKQIALKKNLPPYIIFSDTSLREMAEKLPRTPEEFHAITGVGDHKLRKYGDPFLQEIEDYCRDYGPGRPPSQENELADTVSSGVGPGSGAGGVEKGPATEKEPEIPSSEGVEPGHHENPGRFPRVKRKYLNTSIQDWSVESGPETSPEPGIRAGAGSGNGSRAGSNLSRHSFEARDSLEKTLALTKQRLGIYEIAEIRGLSPETICRQLEKLILAGKIENIDGLVSPVKHKKLREAIKEVESELYSRLLAKMDGSCSEEEIRLVRGLLLSKD